MATLAPSCEAAGTKQPDLQLLMARCPLYKYMMELLLNSISQLLAHLPWHRPALPSPLPPLADGSHTYFSDVQLKELR